MDKETWEQEAIGVILLFRLAIIEVLPQVGGIVMDIGRVNDALILSRKLLHEQGITLEVNE